MGNLVLLLATLATSAAVHVAEFPRVHFFAKPMTSDNGDNIGVALAARTPPRDFQGPSWSSTAGRPAPVKMAVGPAAPGALTCRPRSPAGTPSTRPRDRRRPTLGSVGSVPCAGR